MAERNLHRPPALAQLDNIRNELDEEIAANREEFDNRSEKWLEGEKAAEAEDWLTQLEEFASTMSDMIDASQQVTRRPGEDE